jgi:predicted acyltransferase
MPMESKISRLTSLDAFRGYTVAAMIMVNFPGDWDHVFDTLNHSDWNGLSFTDLVAPFFLFIVGVSIALSHERYRQSDAPRGPVLKKILIRSLKIFLVGMFLNAMPDFRLDELRWTGTLHRIAVVFAVCAPLYLFTGWRAQFATLVVILLGYWFAMTQIPTPGEGAVMLEPGRNLAAWVDSRWLPGRMWQDTWDPEGILSTFPSIATCITGMLAGRILLKAEWNHDRKIAALMSAGVASAALGYFVGLHFPVNENLWTSSFVLVTAGFAALVYGTFHFLTDTLGRTGWTWPGVVFGKNAIAAYVLGDLLALVFYRLPIGGASLNSHVVSALMRMGVEPRLASLFYALLFVSIVFVPVWLLWRKRIFIKL